MTTLLLNSPWGARADAPVGIALGRRLGKRGAIRVAAAAALAATAVTFVPVAPLTMPAADPARVVTDQAADAEAWPAGLAEEARSAIEADTYAVTALAAPNAPGGSAWGAANPAQGLRTDFSPTGIFVEPVEGGWTFGLALSAYGYQGALATPGAPDILVEDNRVDYRRGPLTEWYVNDARGVEQGFTLTAPPPARSVPDAPLVVALGLTGDLTATLDPDGDGLTLTGPGTRLRYDGLVAYDATGRDLPARMTLDANALRLEVNGRGAAYPVTIDPLITNDQATLTASDAAENDGFGDSVAVSGDTAVIGAPATTTAINIGTGKAYVFIRDGNTWSEQASLVVPGLAFNDGFGDSVALSGEVVVVGAPGHDTAAGEDAGSAYVFAREGTSWSEPTELTASDGAAGDIFGSSVAISDKTAVIGAAGDRADRSDLAQGSAYVFSHEGMTWSEQAKLTASEPSEDSFAYSVAISDDTVIAGAAADNADGREAVGAAHVFIREGATWSEQALLTASDGAENDAFGFSVAISGETAVIGAPGDGADVGETADGAVYVFVRDGTSWSEQAKLAAFEEVEADAIGRSVAVSGDTVIVEANFSASNVVAYAFAREGTTWSEPVQLISSDDTKDEVVGSVAVEGDVALVGIPDHDTIGGINSGAAYAFDLSATQLVPPAMSISNVDLFEGDSGKRTARFRVILSAPTTEVVSVRVATANGSARASIDYVPRSTILSFAPGQTTATFDVKVKGDTAVEPDETFLVRLDRPQGATLADAVGTGTILNDD